MKSPIASVVLCTRNPREAHLRRVLDALAAQTLERAAWELIVVDNGSDPPVAGRFDLSWHPRAAVGRAAPAGKVHALIAGFAEAQGEVLVTVDDDNVLDPTYLESAVEILDRHPFLGVANGIVDAEYEVAPPAWVLRFQHHLAIRNRGPRALYSLLPGFRGVPCWGAGMVLRRAVARRWLDEVERDPRHLRFSRRDGSLAGCEDGDIALSAFEVGLATGYFPALRLTHLIPAERTTRGSMLRLVRDNTYAGQLVLILNGAIKPDLGLGARLRAAVDFVRDAVESLHPRRGVMDFRLRRALARGRRAAHLAGPTLLAEAPVRPALHPVMQEVALV